MCMPQRKGAPAEGVSLAAEGACTRSPPTPETPSCALPPGRRASRGYTLSLAVAASCVENAQNLELATLLAGQVARAAAIFRADEVVVLDDSPGRAPGTVSRAAALFGRVLQFMETPQYLKK